MRADRRQVLAGAAALAAPAARATPPRRPRPGFLWGVATAAHQIEGNNVNSDYWVLETIRPTYFHEPSGDACDSFQRWREDIALIKAMGLNAYRFSIEWARIEPERGQYSNAMLDHYRRIAIACREAGIEPVVTFHHFTSPRWIAALGGWENPATADHYARYCERAAGALRGLVGWGCTLNEPNAQVTSQVIAGGSPWAQGEAVRAAAARAVGSDRFGAFFLGDAFRIRDVCLAAHARGRDAIKAALPGAKVGMTLALQQLSPAPGGEGLYRRVYAEARAPFYAAGAKDDFIGVQAYNRMRTVAAGYEPVAPDIAWPDMWHRDADPGALVAVVREVHGATGGPVLVSENGINTADDALRIRHLRASLAALAPAIDGGLPVLGYIHWSLLDNFEWSSGYVPRFGLVAVDRETFARAPKPSFASYPRLIAEVRRAHRWA